jgi:hypothetical protein
MSTRGITTPSLLQLKVAVSSGCAEVLSQFLQALSLSGSPQPSLCEIFGFKPYPLCWVERVSSRASLWANKSILIAWTLRFRIYELWSICYSCRLASYTASRRRLAPKVVVSSGKFVRVVILSLHEKDHLSGKEESGWKRPDLWEFSLTSSSTET